MQRWLPLLFILLITIGNHSLGQRISSRLLDLEEVIEIEKSQYLTQAFTESKLTANYDVKYYRLRLNVDPDTLFIAGSVSTYFIPLQNLTQIVFELNDVLQVDSILHQNAHVSYVHASNLITIHQSFPEHLLDSVTIFYHGSPPENSASFKAEKHNGTPIIWTLSEPYGATDWWPCKPSLTDKADSVDTYVTAPVPNKVAGVGRLMSEITQGNLITTHWKSTYPIVPYLIAIAVTPYAEISFISQLQEGPLWVKNYVYKEDSLEARSLLFATDTLLQFYDSLLGPYPFMGEKYGHAQFGRGGGMEHQTMSFMSHFGFALTAHELAHQWFGNKITCGSWQDIWLNEGFATYFAGLPLETMYNGTEWNSWKTTYLERAVSKTNGSVFVNDTTSVSRIFDPYLSYAKGGYVLHMLRKQIGDLAFFNGIKTYVSDPNLAYASAITSDFFNHVQAQTTIDLGIFKEQWIYGEGYPSYNLEWYQFDETAHLKLAQTTSHSSVPFYYLTVPILFESIHGDSFWIYVPHSHNDQEVTVDVPFQIHQVRIDPDLDIISKANFVINKSDINQLIFYPNPSSDYVKVIPGGEFKRITRYELYSNDGKLIQQESSSTPLTQSFTIDLRNLPQGSYQIIIHSNDKRMTKGLIIAR